MFDEFLNITLLALVDAVNPCTIAVQALLLSALLITKGRRSAIIGGIFFTLTIYVMYFLYGLGILSIIYVIGMESILKWILRILLLVMIFMEIQAYFRYKPGFIAMEMPMRFRPIAQKVIKATTSPFMAIPVAMLCSLLLLPCSSGPYLSALILMRFSLSKFIYLAYYNLIFVLPMILITLIIGFGTMPRKILMWREKNIRYLHLIAGLLLIAVFFMI